MIISILTSILIGLVLAFHRFSVLVLAPLFGLTLMVTGAALFWPHNSAGMLAITFFVIIVGLQVGYILGIGVRHANLIIRASRIRSASFADVRVQRPAN
jgi:hypothetical protein